MWQVVILLLYVLVTYHSIQVKAPHPEVTPNRRVKISQWDSFGPFAIPHWPEIPYRRADSAIRRPEGEHLGVTGGKGAQHDQPRIVCADLLEKGRRRFQSNRADGSGAWASSKMRQELRRQPSSLEVAAGDAHVSAQGDTRLLFTQVQNLIMEPR